MKLVYYVHGIFCFLMFVLVDFLDQAFTLAEIAANENRFLDDIEPEELDRLICERLDD
jgi:hypothetical protein